MRAYGPVDDSLWADAGDCCTNSGTGTRSSGN
jgi:hypothetical protein